MLRFVMSYMYDLLNFTMKKGSKADQISLCHVGSCYQISIG